MEGKVYSFFVCCSVLFNPGIVLALNWKDDLRAEASRNLEIMQLAVPLSQEAKRNLWCSRYDTCVSLYSLVLSKTSEQLHGFQFLVAGKDPSHVFFR